MMKAIHKPEDAIPSCPVFRGCSSCVGQEAELDKLRTDNQTLVKSNERLVFLVNQEKETAVKANHLLLATSLLGLILSSFGAFAFRVKPALPAFVIFFVLVLFARFIGLSRIFHPKLNKEVP